MQAKDPDGLRPFSDLVHLPEASVQRASEPVLNMLKALIKGARHGKRRSGELTKQKDTEHD